MEYFITPLGCLTYVMFKMVFAVCFIRGDEVEITVSKSY